MAPYASNNILIATALYPILPNAASASVSYEPVCTCLAVEMRRHRDVCVSAAHTKISTIPVTNPVFFIAYGNPTIPLPTMALHRFATAPTTPLLCSFTTSRPRCLRSCRRTVPPGVETVSTTDVEGVDGRKKGERVLVLEEEEEEEDAFVDDGCEEEGARDAAVRGGVFVADVVVDDDKAAAAGVVDASSNADKEEALRTPDNMTILDLVFFFLFLSSSFFRLQAYTKKAAPMGGGRVMVGWGLARSLSCRPDSTTNTLTCIPGMEGEDVCVMCE